MKKPLAATLAVFSFGAALLFTAQTATAHDRVSWSVNIGAPVAFAPPPAVYGPPVVVYRQPSGYVYQEPVRVVEYNRHYYGYREHAWREQQRREWCLRHHRPYEYEPYRGRW